MTNAVGAAALGLLIVDPRQLFTASFQMTFLCVLIVAGIGLPMLERTSQLYRQGLTGWDSARYAAMLPPRVAQFRLDFVYRTDLDGAVTFYLDGHSVTAAPASLP